jgi:hypothetical protein
MRLTARFVHRKLSCWDHTAALGEALARDGKAVEGWVQDLAGMAPGTCLRAIMVARAHGADVTALLDAVVRASMALFLPLLPC